MVDKSLVYYTLYDYLYIKINNNNYAKISGSSIYIDFILQLFKAQ